MKKVDSAVSTNEWITLSLSSVGIWKGGGTPSTNHREYWDNGTIPWVSPKDMKSCKILETIDSITRNALNQSTVKLIPNNSVLIVVRSGILKRMLPIAIAKVDVTTNQDLQSITPSTGILSSFLYWSLVANGDQIRNDCAKDGTTVDSIDVLKLKSFLIKVPPLPEQRAIVSKIESLFSELDAGVASLEAAKAQLKVYRQAVLKAGFEGGLVDNVDYLRKTLSSISGLITKGSSPKWQGFDYTNESDSLLFITSENVRDNYLDISAPKYLPLSFSHKEKRSQLKENDVLLNIVGASIGRAAVFKSTHAANINQAVALIRLHKDVFPPYVSYFLNSAAMKIEYRKKAVDVARANISLKDVGNIVIPLPETQDQFLIVSEIESRFSLADKLEETIDASLAQAASLRQSVLKRAFEGKLLTQAELEACRREPDWESAEKLLERIKAERAASDEGRATAAQRKRAGKRSRAS
jgi:restriction endonuclease S subunit